MTVTAPHQLFPSHVLLDTIASDSGFAFISIEFREFMYENIMKCHHCDSLSKLTALIQAKDALKQVVRRNWPKQLARFFTQYVIAYSTKVLWAPAETTWQSSRQLTSIRLSWDFIPSLFAHFYENSYSFEELWDLSLPSTLTSFFSLFFPAPYLPLFFPLQHKLYISFLQILADTSLMFGLSSVSLQFPFSRVSPFLINIKCS